MLLRKFFPAVLMLSLAACGPATTPRVDTQVVGAGLPVARYAAPPKPRAQGIDAVTFAVWSSRDLPGDVLRAARRHDGVIASSPAYSGTVDLRTVGATVKRPRRHILPLSVIAVSPDPLLYDANFLAVAHTLENGDAALNAQSATLRGLKLGTTIGVGKKDGAVRIRVGAVMRADSFFEHELVLPLEQAKDLRLDGMRAIIVAARPNAVQDVTRALIDAAGDTPVRVRALQGYEEAGTVLPFAKIKDLFGEFPYVKGAGDSIVPDPRWVNVAVVDWKVPLLGTVRCHRNIVSQLAFALWEIEQRGLGDLLDSYNGCYVPRFQRGDPTTLSAHAWGIAIDLNAASNGMGDAPMMDPRIVGIMKKWGFAWGGDWLVPDGMHFEFSSYPPKAQFDDPLD